MSASDVVEVVLDALYFLIVGLFVFGWIPEAIIRGRRGK